MNNLTLNTRETEIRLTSKSISYTKKTSEKEILESKISFECIPGLILYSKLIQNFDVIRVIEIKKGKMTVEKNLQTIDKDSNKLFNLSSIMNVDSVALRNYLLQLSEDNINLYIKEKNNETKEEIEEVKEKTNSELEIEAMAKKEKEMFDSFYIQEKINMIKKHYKDVLIVLDVARDTLITNNTFNLHYSCLKDCVENFNYYNDIFNISRKYPDVIPMFRYSNTFCLPVKYYLEDICIYFNSLVLNIILESTNNREVDFNRIYKDTNIKTLSTFIKYVKGLQGATNKNTINSINNALGDKYLYMV